MSTNARRVVEALRARRRSSAPAPAPAPGAARPGTVLDGYSYAESVHAGPFSPNHVRRVGEDGRLYLGGGVPNPAVCGRDLHHGWDLPGPVILEEVASRSTRRSDGRLLLCESCAAVVLGPPPDAAA